MHRIEWIDTAKGIGIILVVLGHTSITNSAEAWIFSFHMPLFFFISGFLFRASNNLNLKKFATKKARSLLIPYFIFALITYLFWVLTINNLSESPKEWYIPLIGIFYSVGVSDWLVFNSPLWFLTCLYIVEIIYFLINRATKGESKTIMVILIISSLIGYSTSLYLPIRLPWSIDVALTALVFFGVGKIFSNNKDKLELNKWFMILLFISMLLINNVFTNQKVDMNFNFYGDYFNFYIAAFSGIVTIIIGAQFLMKYKFLKYIGINSLIILCLHKLIIIIITKAISIGIPGYDSISLMWNSLISIITLAILVPIILFINRYLGFILGKKERKNIKFTKNTNAI